MGRYHDTVPFAKNNFAKAAKSAASKCNIERHPLLETASRNHRPTRSGTPRYGAPDAPLVDFSLSSAQVAVTRGPLVLSVRMYPAGNQYRRRGRKKHNLFSATCIL